MPKVSDQVAPLHGIEERATRVISVVPVLSSVTEFQTPNPIQPASTVVATATPISQEAVSELLLMFPFKGASLDAFQIKRVRAWLTSHPSALDSGVELVAFAANGPQSRELSLGRSQAVERILLWAGVPASKVSRAVVVTDHPGRKVQLRLRGTPIYSEAVRVGTAENVERVVSEPTPAPFDASARLASQGSDESRVQNP